ncbi:hypothetical protein KRR40_04530 [Niabella defluvii]|nr:hypothetical protein KRR40_04530 [Niabella sp. I65]
MQLFFDLKGHSEAGNFYFALQDATLSINHTDITLQKGFLRTINMKLPFGTLLPMTRIIRVKYKGRLQASTPTSS